MVVLIFLKQFVIGLFDGLHFAEFKKAYASAQRLFLYRVDCTFSEFAVSEINWRLLDWNDNQQECVLNISH